VGELAALYAVAETVFVGGSLVPIGGHNVLEPAMRGKRCSWVARGNFREARSCCSGWGGPSHDGRAAARLARLLEDCPPGAWRPPANLRRTTGRGGATLDLVG
jgi:3-deoxy-D-manno-octulosonic-acid transferase